MTAALLTPTRPALHDPRPIEQVRVLAARSVRNTFRQPAAFLPGIFFPLFIAAINNAALTKAIHLPGFPEVDTFLDFVMAATIVQGVMFASIMGGSDLALDIENGFFERLVASPVWRPSILIGRLSGAAVLGAFQAVLFAIVFILFGAHVEGGLAGLVVLVIVASILALGVGGLAAAIGLRTGSAEAVQNAFPMVFILVFISSAFFPTELMNGWYKAVASHNPMSWMIDGMRHQVIVGFDVGEALTAIAVVTVLAVLSIGLATRQMARRLSVSS